MFSNKIDNFVWGFYTLIIITYLCKTVNTFLSSAWSIQVSDQNQIFLAYLALKLSISEELYQYLFICSHTYLVGSRD